MEDPKSKKGSPQGIGVPAKGDSSASDEPLDSLDGATISDISLTPLPALVQPPDRVADPEATISDAPVPLSHPADKLPTRVVDPDATISDGTPAAGTPARAMASIYIKEAALQPGHLIGARYEILSLLGEGGMGAVYKALDREVGRPVALKLIRPDLASNPVILARFKQELLTATQVTHKNVIRTYDISEADGVKFITMEFVEGDDLRRILLDNGKLQPEKAIAIIRQICLALEAAHSAGIIHRDLKPQNIIQEAKTGRILVMDFGLARSIESEGMTQTGALLGTIEYMSPEQSMGKTLDQRSDVFSVGLIFYELLTGNMPYKADSAMASLLRRNQERAIPAAELDTSIPKGLSDIVAKCLERDLAQRYQDVQEILKDLDAYLGSRPVMASMAGTVPAPVIRSAVPWKWIGAGTLALVVAVGGWALRSKFGGSTVAPNNGSAHAPVSVLVADFTNHTGDTIFDGTLEPMFNVALEGASFINAYNRGTARKMAQKLPNPTDKLDEQPARLVALSQGVSAVITGEISRRGDQYSVSAIALDAATGNVIAKNEVMVANKEAVLPVIPKLAAPIRKSLGDTTPESVQLAATQGSFAASNLEAAHQYSIAMEQQFSGKFEDALQSFSKAAELDPNFARAFAGIAGTAGNLGQIQNAEKYAKLAMEHVDRMTERERYRVRGQYYIRTENWQKCIEEYSELVKQYPADNMGQSNLAACYARMLNMPKAMEEAQRALQMAPKDVMTRMNFSLYACYATDFQNCERGAQEVIKLNPAYEEASFALAYAQLGQNQMPQATETYQKLEKVSPWGTSLAGSGLANLALYQGRLREAVQILEKGSAADLAAKNPDAAADKFMMLAEASLLRGDKQSAQAAAQRALANSQSVKIRFLAARTFVEAGETGKARKLAASLASELQAAPRAYAKLVLGEVALKEHNPKQAIQLFTEAKDLVDTWIGRFDLGRAYLEAGAFAEADSEFDRCLKRRGEALELFMDDAPTYSYLPIVYYYQGRVREGLKSPGFADSYRTYLSIRGNSGEDPLVPEIHRRLGQ